MALNFNIPMPDVAGSFQKGFGLTDNLMHQMLGRNQLKQKTAHDEAALKQLESHFQQNLGLSKAAAGRAALAAADAHQESLNKRDPTYPAQQYAALEDYWRSRGNQGMQQGVNPAEQQAPQPTQEMGEGMGMYSPQGMQEAQQQPMQQQAPQQAQQQQNPNNPMGIDFELMKQHPMLRGFAKKHLGYDPLAPVPQTPAEKQADQIDLFKQKEAIKAANKEGSGEKATQAVITENQKAVQALDTVIPEIQDIINHPEKIYGKYDFSPNKINAYNAKTGSIIDKLIVAQQLPKVLESIEIVKQQIQRGTNESTDAYKNRLKELNALLTNQRADKRNVLKTGKINITDNNNDYSHMSEDELRKIAGGGQ